MGVVKTISIPENMAQRCKEMILKGDERYKWSQVWRRGFVALEKADETPLQNEKIERLIEKLNYFVKRCNFLEAEIANITAERGK